MSARVRLLALIGIGAVFLAVTGPVALRLGFSAEETVGLLRVAPDRLYPDTSEATDSELEDLPGMRTSRRIPVWGMVSERGEYFPVMIDGHMGALSFYPARALARLGPTAARAQSLFLGLLAIALVFLLAREIGGDRVAFIAALLMASSSQTTFAFSWVRPDEQLDAMAHVAGLLCAIRFGRTDRVGWLYAAAFLFGFGVACKNTAVWITLAVAGAAIAFRLVPRLRTHQWATCAGLFLAPLVPELLYLASSEPGAMSSRLSMISRPWEGLAPERIAFSVRHFAQSLAHSGSAVGGYIAGEPHRAPAFFGVGYLMCAAAAICVAGAFSRVSTTAARAFGAGFGLLFLQYVTFYYRGESFYLLFVPLAPIAMAIAGVAMWNGARSLQGSRARQALTGAIAATGLIVLVNNAVEAARYQRAVAKPGAAMFDRSAQERATALLEYLGDDRPIVTTYGGLGVFELLSDGAVRPRYAFPYFHREARGDRAAFRRAWTRLLERLEPGRHLIVLIPNPSPVDTSPVEHGAYIASELRPAAKSLGLLLVSRERFFARGQIIIEIVEITIEDAI